MTKVKICGLTSKDDALLAVKAGADAVGVVNVRESKRFVDLGKAREIFRTVPVFVSKVVVATPKSLGEALEIEETGADYIQLHGEEGVDFIRELREKTRLGIIKKITVDGNSLENSRKYSGIVDAILLDTGLKGTLGGTGMVHDWDISKKIVESLEEPVILAGGLNPKNVEKAIEKVKPYAVDVSSGVESTPGRKDEKKIREFIRDVKNGAT